FISNMLLVAAHAEQDVELVHVGEVLPSLPHIDMTMETLRQAGVEASHDLDAPGRHVWRVHPRRIRRVEGPIEPDPSTAGPFLAAALATGGTIAVDDWPYATTRPGDAYRDLLMRMGGEVWREGTALCVHGTGELHGIDADMSAM